MIIRKLAFEQCDMISDAVWSYAIRFDDLDERAEVLQLLANYDFNAMEEVLNMLNLDDMLNDIKAVKEAIANKADEILYDPGAWDDYMNEACSC